MSPLSVFGRLGSGGKTTLWNMEFNIISICSHDIPAAGRLVHGLVHTFPKLQLQTQVQPITLTLHWIELTNAPDLGGKQERYLVLRRHSSSLWRMWMSSSMTASCHASATQRTNTTPCFRMYGQFSITTTSPSSLTVGCTRTRANPFHSNSSFSSP
ncbi:hypothetical protein M378DRAFT_391428 [Amanita muscaria Koide BX008]|uniref:Uncharacterized protein n=1 Tax=Amanita muscaria (strain Koide BX008) TaxID=946122 RepID=A0A0C2WXF1_AMAMK|nr:hypothetical protein M378DRAFT_391428 [Amanita muscaria Koide BX008]